MPEVSAAGKALAEAISRRGMTQKQVAAALGVSDRMVRQVLSGNKPGRNLEAAARQLAREGRVTEAPPRRAQRVRAKGGVTEPVAPKVDKTTTVEAGKRSQTTIHFPPRGIGRVAAAQAVLDDLDAHKAGRVTVVIHLRTGQAVTIGGRRGYVVRSMRRRMMDEGEDALAWLVDEADKIEAYAGVGVTQGAIVKVVLTYFP